MLTNFVGKFVRHCRFLMFEAWRLNAAAAWPKEGEAKREGWQRRRSVFMVDATFKQFGLVGGALWKRLGV